MDIPLEDKKEMEIHPIPDRMVPHLPEYTHRLAIKKGLTRMERHPASGMSGAPKKAGHGGKYTWAGPTDPEKDLEPVPAALDEKDPNYAEEDEEGDYAGKGDFEGYVDEAPVEENVSLKKEAALWNIDEVQGESAAVASAMYRTSHEAVGQASSH